MRFELLAILYGLACVLPVFPALPQAPQLPQSVARIRATEPPSYDPYSWKPTWGRTDALALFYGSEQVGAFDYSNGVFTGMVRGQWVGPQRVPPDAPPLPPDPSHVYYGADRPTRSATYEWRGVADDAGQVALYLDGTQIGGYSFVTGLYRPVDATTGAWGSPTKCPTTPPLSPPKPRGTRPLSPPSQDSGYYLQPAGGSCAGGSCGAGSPGRGFFRRR